MDYLPLKDLELQVKTAFSPQKWGNVRALVAVSGGADSVAILRAMVAIGLQTGNWQSANLIAAHINHGTRGSESNADAVFVEALAAKLGLEFRQAAAEPDQAVGTSEESLRDFRYDQLLELAQSLGARYIVMGHNLDDQVETILFRIFRGTGISGLIGIPNQRLASQSVTIIRPLLEVSRQEIEKYLGELDQPFRSDRSNADCRYTRNFLRNELLPILKERFTESVSESVLRLGKQALEIDTYLLTRTQELSDALLKKPNGNLTIDCKKLLSRDPLIIRRWLAQLWTEQDWPRQAMTFQWWQNLAEAIQSRDDLVFNLPCSIRFEKSGDVATFLDLR